MNIVGIILVPLCFSPTDIIIPITLFSDPGNVQYLRYFDPENYPLPTTTLQVFSINIIHHKTCSYFHHKKGFLKSYYLDSRERNIGNHFLQFGRGGRDNVSSIHYNLYICLYYSICISVLASIQYSQYLVCIAFNVYLCWQL
jgi:hypothetical protein